MQQHLSNTVEPEIVQFEPEPPALPVQAGYSAGNAAPLPYATAHAIPVHPAQLQHMPPLDAYSSVCVRVREASIIASNDPIACNHGGTVPPLPPVQQAAAPRKRFSPALVAAWLCVLQLGIIITLLAGQSWHLDQAVGSIKQSLGSLSVPKLQAFLHAGDAAFGDEQEASTPKAAGANKKKTHGRVNSTKSRKAPSGIQFAWPTAKNFVPPPPPSMPTEKLLVPPPPVAFNFPLAPGAVAASTLPPVAAPLTEPVKKSPAEKEKKHALEPTNSDGASISAQPEAPAAKTQAKAQAQAQVPVPGASALSSAAAMPNEEPPFFGADENEPLILPGPMPVAASSPASIASSPAPAIAPARQPAAAHSQVPAIRTVISGNRKRIIADR